MVDSSKNFVSKLADVFVVFKAVYMLHVSICPASLDRQEFQGLLFIRSIIFYSLLSLSFLCILYFSFLWAQGLQDEIKLVPLILQNRPAWYSEKVYPPNKVNTLFISYLIFINASFYYFPSLVHISLIFLSIFVDNIAVGLKEKRKKNCYASV